MGKYVGGDSMVLDNYWQIKFASSQYSMWQEGGAGKFVTASIKALNGTTISTIQCSFNGVMNSIYNALKMYALRSNLGARLGTGNTEPTSSDYALDSDITSSIGSLNVTTSVGGDSGLVTNIVISGINTTASEIVIKELGIYINSAFTMDGTSYDVLIVRELLEQPLAVPAGKGFTLVFKWVEA